MYYEVNSASGALIKRVVTETEAIRVADANPNSVIVPVAGTMPDKFTVEDARRVMEELRADTPENRRRDELFKQWADSNPGWQSIKEKFGDGGAGN